MPALPSMKRLLLLISGALALASCQSSAPSAYNLSVSYDPVTIERFRVFPSVEVDIVEANETTLKQLEQTEIDDYFDPANVLRDSLRKMTFYFSEEDCEKKTLSRDDKVWQSWLEKRGASHLVLFINLPRDGAKGPDMRRLTLPLAADRWDGEDIDVSIIPAGLLLQTPIKPEDN